MSLQFNQSRLAWFILSSSALILELIALYFQYAMGLEPCIKCIYQRLALWGVFIASLPALIFPTEKFTRLISYLSGIFFAGWGYKIASEHVDIQTNPNPFAGCAFMPDFPSWFAPDVWFPALFEVRGDCGSIDWQFLSLSMPQWMQLIFGLYLAVFCLVPLYHLVKFKQI
ncbi:disulfide bond formation protein DsbB [Catenovulum adriaticum]|uniref:Disulfide bond formation protein B n=1 Tax=Catenovulum adriaticum TaxID=2984846 RepID=A0ABY7APZ3_9ALTE|nr:disulfide bond formation protein DsbB [Catenovulum sp. TS8]WAJ71318.1 disulfide bond formation protein DsbB [Catenovulum sp. TS8]